LPLEIPARTLCVVLVRVLVLEKTNDEYEYAYEYERDVHSPIAYPPNDLVHGLLWTRPKIVESLIRCVLSDK